MKGDPSSMSAATLHRQHHSTTQPPAPVTGPVVVGVDTHQQSHWACVLEHNGRRVADAQFPASAAGYVAMVAWIQDHAPAGVAAIGVESTGSYGAGLTRHLLATTDLTWTGSPESGPEIFEVIRPDKTTRAMRGKSDAVDAEAAARAVISGTATGRPKISTGIVESIRTLTAARSSAVKQRTAAYLQIRDLVTTAPDQLREQLLPLSNPARARHAARLRPDLAQAADPTQGLKLALRALGRRIAVLDTEIAEHDTVLTQLVASAAPRLLALPGIGTHSAAQLLVTGGQNIDRLRTEATFAKLVGVAPIPASSGKTTRHRLNRGGDRSANSVIHMLVLRRLANHAPTKAYRERRTLDPQMSTPDIIRCLKRYAAREIYHALRTDLLST